MATCEWCQGTGVQFTVDRRIIKKSSDALKRTWGENGIARLAVECVTCGGRGDTDPDPASLAIFDNNERPRG